jgi:hypothetical protein
LLQAMQSVDSPFHGLLELGEKLLPGFSKPSKE